MKTFLGKIFSGYFRPFLTVLLVVNIFAFIYFIMYVDLTESAKRFGDVILGVLLSKLGTTVDFWLGNTDREHNNNNHSENDEN